eukprot:12898994-Prorocentrum_lima.AAC.1
MPTMLERRNGRHGEEEGEWDPEDPEGYDEEDAAHEEEDKEADQEGAEEVDGSVMHVEILPQGDGGQV